MNSMFLPSCQFYLFGVLCRFQQCTGHITMGSLVGRGNHYIQLVKVLYCKLSTIVKQQPPFAHKVRSLYRQSQRWEASDYQYATVSPAFMSRPKPNSDPRRVIVGLSWPKDKSVNNGVDKHGYIGTDFSITFSTIDHLTAELTKLGPEAHIYKTDVSHAFWHLNIKHLSI